MVIWIWVIIALAVAQIIMIPYQPGLTFYHISSVLILIASLGMSYRIYSKQRDGKFEELEQRVRELEQKVERIKN